MSLCAVWWFSKGRVSVHAFFAQTCFDALKTGADSKRKKYGCVIWLSKAITMADVELLNSTCDVLIEQDTPMRVCHRRSLMTRRKIIHAMHATRINAHFMMLELTTSAGAYVKEFVHGDRGRTTPSVGSLLVSHLPLSAYSCFVRVCAVTARNVHLAICRVVKLIYCS